jgi:acetyl esterase/lipase
MSLTTAFGQAPNVPAGVRILQMEDDPADLRAAMKKRMATGLADVLQTAIIHRCRWLLEHDPVTFARHIAWLREHMKGHLGPVLTLQEAEAMKTAGPHVGLPGPPIPAEWFAPRKGEPRGFVLYVHGGSFIAERSPKVTALIGRFAAAANARVFAPTYRLAPENPCPAAIEDIEGAFAWLARIYPDEPVVGLAESSGSAILLSAVLRMKARGEPLPRGLILLSPWVDLSLQSRSVLTASMFGAGRRTMDAMALMARLYLRDMSAADPVASPLYGDLAGLPPMLIHASKADMLYDDAVRLADRMRAVNGDLTVRLWTTEGHVWEREHGQGLAARDSIRLAADFIRAQLA